MKKPLILLTPQIMPMEEPFQANYNYTNCFNTGAILAAGGMPIIPSLSDDENAESLMSIADGLFMTGGGDIGPSLYGEEKLESCGAVQPERDRSDLALMKAALKFKKPIFCVCRGFQLANVYFGGTLYQDLPTQRPSSLSHSVYSYPEYAQETTHTVELVENSPLFQLLGEKSIGVNSLHHQAIRDLAPGLLPMAYAPDGILESWYLPSDDQWIRAYQWHPEMQDANSRNKKILEDFIAACIQH